MFSIFSYLPLFTVNFLKILGEYRRLNILGDFLTRFGEKCHVFQASTEAPSTVSVYNKLAIIWGKAQLCLPEKKIKPITYSYHKVTCSDLKVTY